MQDQEGDHHVQQHDPEAALSDSYNALSVSNHEENNHKKANKHGKEKEEPPRSMNWRVIAAAVTTKNKNNDSIPLTHTPSNPAHSSEKGQSNNKAHSSGAPTPRLLHPWLLRIPMQIRFGIYGTLSSALFMVMYNAAVYYLEKYYVPSTIYAGVYLVYIPLQHWMACTLVFGWPNRYFASLMSNVPIALTAIALGSFLTAFLDKNGFEETLTDIANQYGLVLGNAPKEANNGEFYSSMVVLILTSFWTFVLTVLVNSPADETEKKQL